MRANAGRIIFVISLFAFTSTNCVRAQQNGVPKDDDVRVIGFEDLKYPMLAQQTRTQGAVVVQVKLDDQGGVIDGRVARPLILNFRVPHLSRRATGGICDFGSFIDNCTPPFERRKSNQKPRP